MKTKVVLVLVLATILSVSVSAQEVKADLTKSELKWSAKKVTGEHNGAIKLKEGELALKGEQIGSGKFVIDMKSIVDEDLPVGEWNNKLVGHLKSDDFFGVEKYPESVLVITGSTPFVNNKATVKGKLTIKGITNPIEFEATRAGNMYTARVTVDRTLYNVRYGSGKFFENLGDKTIYDDFYLDVKLVTL